MSIARSRAPRDAAAFPLAAIPLAAALLAGCAAQSDHFYTLTAVSSTSSEPPAPAAPSGPAPRAAAYTRHVILSISLPAVIDRREMVIQTSRDQLIVLEHQRWPVPLSELAAQTLARDIEERRPDVLVADRSFDQPRIALTRIRVDIVRMSARTGAQATLEAHWRIKGGSQDEIGGGTFSAPLAPLERDDYAAVARAFSSTLGSLASRLAEKLPEQ